MSNCLPYSLFIKPVGGSCNLDCSYCYYLNQNTSQKMTLDTLRTTIVDHIHSQPAHTPQVDFIWHGGEPMMRGLRFYQHAVAEQKRYTGKKAIVNTMQTNGTLITENWARFFARNKFMVGVSIDGPELIHNIGRIDTRGESTFERTMKGMALLKEHNVEFNTLTVINNCSYHRGKEIYRFLKENGSSYMQFQPCIDHELDRRSEYDWSLSGKQWGRFLCDVFDEWCKADITKVYVQFFENCLMVLMDYPSQMCHHAPTCGQQLMMEANGEVYSCDHFGYQTHSLGKTCNGSLKSLVNSERQRQFGEMKQRTLSSQCQQCDFLPMCQGGCPKNRTLKTAQDEPLNQLCEGYQIFFRHALPRMLRMVDAMKSGYSPQYYELF